MYYSYVEIEYVATRFSPARMDLAVKLLRSNGCDTKMEIMRLKKDLQKKGSQSVLN
jgi:hypothetical protein